MRALFLNDTEAILALKNIPSYNKIAMTVETYIDNSPPSWNTKINWRSKTVSSETYLGFFDIIKSHLVRGEKLKLPSCTTKLSRGNEKIKVTILV